MRMTCKRLAFVAALTMAAACGDDAKNNAATNNTGTNNDTANNGADAGNNTNTDVDNSDAEYASEYETIFDSLVFSNAPANKLNDLVMKNLVQTLEFPIIVLLQVDTFDIEAGTLMLRGGSGLKTETEGVYAWDPDSESEGTLGTLVPDTGEFSAELASFGFVASFKFENEVNKVTLPIKNLTIDGKLALDEGGATARVVDGTLAGILTKADGDATQITLAPGGSPISITQLFKESSLNWDTATNAEVEPGTGDAWYIAGTFTANPVDIDD